MMKKSSDLYGFEAGDLNSIAKQISHALDIELEFRSSDFLGDYYRHNINNIAAISLHTNIFDFGEEIREPEFAEYPLLLYVLQSESISTIQAKLLAAFGSNIQLLRRADHSPDS